MLDLLGELNSAGRTLVVVTHDPNVARRADRVLLVRDGEIVQRIAGSDVVNLAQLFEPEESTAGEAR